MIFMHPRALDSAEEVAAGLTADAHNACWLRFDGARLAIAWHMLRAQRGCAVQTWPACPPDGPASKLSLASPGPSCSKPTRHYACSDAIDHIVRYAAAALG